jgi:hypothetical protein
MMIIVMPMAPRATTMVWARTMRKLRAERYCSGVSLRMAKIPMTRTSPRNGPRRLSHRLLADACSRPAADVSVTSSGVLRIRLHRRG